MSIKSLTALHDSYLNRQSADDRNGQKEVIKDGSLPVTPYKEPMVDNSCTDLHPARFQRAPLASPRTWYHKVPTERTPVIIGAIPLEVTGTANLIPETTIKTMHNRAKKLTLEMFHTGSFDPKKVVDTADSYEAIYFQMECLGRYAAVNQQMYPLDTSPVTIYNVLQKYRWVVAATNGAVRRSIITTFFNSVMKLNASNFNSRLPPLKYAEMEIEIRKCFIDEKITPDTALMGRPVPPEVPQASNQSFGNQSRNGGGRRGGNTGGRGAGRSRGNFNQNGERRVANYQGKSVCRNYNQFGTDNCGRISEEGGCRTRDGSIHYAYVCNVFVEAQNEFCYGNHPRAQHGNAGAQRGGRGGGAGAGAAAGNPA